MSDIDRAHLPHFADCSLPQLEALIERIVELTVAKVHAFESNPFLNGKACAELIGVSPEHLCAMRARGQGPPWSGHGKWIRYDRQVVLDWISSLPINPNEPCATAPQQANRLTLTSR